MNDRIQLQYLLERILGNKNVYFQPPSNIHLKYPCIVYKYSDGNKQYANNNSYITRTKYSIQLIIDNPDNTIKDDLLALPYCVFDRFFAKNGLNHYNYQIYY